MAKWDDVSKAYTFETIASAYLVDFTANDNGDYYVSAMTVSDKNGDYRLIDTYRKDEAGSYTMVTPGSLQVTYKGEAGFDGFYNKEWFKKNVLNLSGTSRYESGTATGDDIDTLKIEVTTLTLQELADLADASITAEDSYCGIDLADVDLFYFSGQGNYGAEPSNMVSAATVIAKLAFGVDGSGISQSAGDHGL